VYRKRNISDTLLKERSQSTLGGALWGLYAGFDLHSNNRQVGIVNEEGKKIPRKKLPNEPDAILCEREPHRTEIMGIAVESTYN